MTIPRIDETAILADIERAQREAGIDADERDTAKPWPWQPPDQTAYECNLCHNKFATELARRANALVLLDDGMSYAAAAKVLLLGDDTVRTWRRLCEDDGIEGLAGFGYGGPDPPRPHVHCLPAVIVC